MSSCQMNRNVLLNPRIDHIQPQVEFKLAVIRLHVMAESVKIFIVVFLF
jgi:hypothetical protein